MAELTIPAVSIPPTDPIAGEPMRKKIIPLSGKLITAEDPLVIGENFRTLKNMRYTDSAIKSIGGMTKINSSIMNATYFKARNAHQFKKPSEDHLLVQAFNTGLTAAQVLQNTTAPPTAGNFSGTALWSDTTRGRFSSAPGGTMAYCNGEDSCIWGGDEDYIGAFINFDPNGTFSYDYTDAVRDESDEVATLEVAGMVLMQTQSSCCTLIIM